MTQATTSEVTSADGTRIAYDRLGDGPVLILVAGATCDRAKMRPTAERLARDLSVVNYDRRGRGDSGDTQPYAVEREVEDVAALVEAAGGTAAVYGHSSGAALALHAAAQAVPMTRLVVHEAPYVASEEHQRGSREFAEQLRPLLADGRHGEAMELFMTVVGYPAELVEAMRRDPSWAALEAMAPTLAYDAEVMGDDRGGTVPTDMLGGIAVPALVLYGGASPDWMLAVGQTIAGALQDARFEVLAGQDHVVDPDLLAPVVTPFVTG